MEHKPFEIKLTLPGGKLAEMMYKTLVDNGIATLWTNRVKIRAAIAEQNIEQIKSLSAEQRKQDLKALREGKTKFVDGEIVQVNQYDGFDLKTLEQLAVHSTFRDTIRKEINLAMAIEHAESILLDEKQSSDQPKQEETTEKAKIVDTDWLFRWRENACQVSQESMQQLWGKVLAGEIRKPGSVSLRTLEVLKTLSKEDAELIQKMFSYAINRAFIYRHKPFKNDNELFYKYENVLDLESMGLIHGAQTQLAYEIDYSIELGQMIGLVSHNIVIITRMPLHKGTMRVNIPCYFLTPIGRELSFIGNFEANLEYLLHVCNSLKRYNIECQLLRFEDNDSGERLFFHAFSGERVILNE